MTNVGELQAAVDQYGWYHSIELGDGVVTPGMFDHRGVVEHYLIPEDLTGKRCLDVGTMDGFWAFEMERRGAASVVAVDLDDPERLDWPASLRTVTTKTLDETKGARFELVRRSLGSSVQRELRSVYELDPADLGEFDFVFCGDLLCHLKDPATAAERLRAVCRGTAVIATVTVKVRFAERIPLARFDGVDEFEWWAFNQAGLVRLAQAAGFRDVESGRPFALPATAGGVWKGRRGVVRGHA